MEWNLQKLFGKVKEQASPKGGSPLETWLASGSRGGSPSATGKPRKGEANIPSGRGRRTLPPGKEYLFGSPIVQLLDHGLSLAILEPPEHNCGNQYPPFRRNRNAQKYERDGGHDCQECDNRSRQFAYCVYPRHLIAPLWLLPLPIHPDWPTHRSTDTNHTY